VGIITDLDITVRALRRLLADQNPQCATAGRRIKITWVSSTMKT